jgi:hypothetical protein
MSNPLRGSARALILYDVCEAIDLEALRAMFGARRTGPSFKHAAPEYVRFQRPPVVEPLEHICFDSGEQFDAQIKYYDYGVVSIIFEQPFSGEWEDLVQRASRWIVSGEFERRASHIARQKLDKAGAALAKPYSEWLAEDYFIFHLTCIPGNPSGAALLSTCGDDIARIVRGETERLADAERNEVLQSSLSYYPNDLTLIGWNAAFLYDTITGAQTAIDLLEYANSQLLEFRHYDELLTRELASVYNSLDRGSGGIRRWRLAREAARLQTLALDVTELAERADNAIKFVSDMFSARLYRMAAAKVGVIDYKNLVNQKLRIAAELYEFMIQQFQQGRAFVLELMIVLILVIDLVFLFRGK